MFTTPETDRLLTTAELLGVQRQTLAEWRSCGRYRELRYHRVGRAVRYRLSDVLTWLDSRAVGGAVEASA